MCSQGTWWLTNAHRIPSLHGGLSFPQANIHPTISPCWVRTALFLRITLVPWPLHSPFPLSGFLVSDLQVLFPNSSSCVQQLTLHQQCQSTNAHFLATQWAAMLTSRYWTLLHKLKSFYVFKDFYFSNTGKSFLPSIPRNTAISGTLMLLNTVLVLVFP